MDFRCFWSFSLGSRPASLPPRPYCRVRVPVAVFLSTETSLYQPARGADISDRNWGAPQSLRPHPLGPGSCPGFRGPGLRPDESLGSGGPGVQPVPGSGLSPWCRVVPGSSRSPGVPGSCRGPRVPGSRGPGLRPKSVVSGCAPGGPGVRPESRGPGVPGVPPPPQASVLRRDAGLRLRRRGRHRRRAERRL